MEAGWATFTAEFSMNEVPSADLQVWGIASQLCKAQEVLQMKLMTYKLVLASAFIAAAFTSVAAKAQTILNIPFSFNVGHSIVPAGAYSVERSGAPWGGFVTMKNVQSNASFTWTVSPGDPAPTDTRIVLRFDEIGQMHLLRSVQYHSMITSRLDEDVRRNERRELRSREGM